MITRDPKNILVADDSIFFRIRLSDILTEAGHKVRFSKDGSEVIAELKKNPSGIDLLILDLQMPEVDGFGVLKWLDENGLRGKVPVLAVTGVYEPQHVLEELKYLGANGLITKGFTPEQIVFRINRLLFPEKDEDFQPRDRVPVSIPVDFTIGDVTNTGFLLNISESGAFLHTKAEILSGAYMRLKFTLPGVDHLFDIKAVVRWGTAEIAKKALFGGFGVMFTAIADSETAMLKNFVLKELQRAGLFFSDLNSVAKK
jgi:CheY-like chemotaxis protein